MASPIDFTKLAIETLIEIKHDMPKKEIEFKLLKATRVMSEAIRSFAKNGVTPPCPWADRCVKLIEGDDEINGACTHTHMPGEREQALKKFAKPDDNKHATEPNPKNKSNAKTVDCMFFAKGECKKGDNCTFIHNVLLFIKTSKTDDDKSVKSKKTTDDDKSVKSKKPTGKTYATAAAGGGGEVVVENLDTDS
jgi:hypothetical protein